MNGISRGWVLAKYRGPKKAHIGLGQANGRLRVVEIELGLPIDIGDYVEVNPDGISITHRSDVAKRLTDREKERIML